MSRQPLHLHWRALLGLWALIAALLWSGTSLAHSSSNSYLTLSAPEGRLSLRADLHLRDVDLIFDLDADRDGQVSWGETRMRSAELASWLDQGLQLRAAGQKCQLGLADLQASEHADGR
jgi:hypothetical protein